MGTEWIESGPAEPFSTFIPNRLAKALDELGDVFGGRVAVVLVITDSQARLIFPGETDGQTEAMIREIATECLRAPKSR